MLIPQSVKSLIGCFHQDIFLIETTLDGIIAHASQFVLPSELGEARHFLSTILDGSHSSDQIRTIWDSLSKGIRIDSDQDLVKFLEYLRDNLPVR